LCIIWSVVYYFVSCALLGSVVYYSVSCVLLGQLCIFGQLCITRSVVHYSVSCVLLGQLCITICQLCITRSVENYSVGCAILGQLCITRSVVSVTLGRLCSTRLFVHYSVSCVVLRQLGSTRSIVYTRLVVCYSAYWSIDTSWHKSRRWSFRHSKFSSFFWATRCAWIFFLSIFPCLIILVLHPTSAPITFFMVLPYLCSLTWNDSRANTVFFTR